MATLYSSATNARKVIFVFLAITVLLMIWNFISGFLNSQKLVVNNEAERFYMKSDQSFGLIARPTIKGIEYNSDAQFRRESIHTQQFPDVAYIYKIEKPREKLLSVQNARDTVAELGFNPNDSQTIGDNVLQWVTANGSRIIKYNKLEQTWELRTQYFENTNALERKSIQSDLQKYISLMGNIISRLGFETFGFQDASVEARFAKLGVDGVFIDTTSVAEAEYVYLNANRVIRFADLKPTEEQPQIVTKTGQKVTPPPPYDALVYSDDPRYGEIRIVASNDVSDYSADIFEMDFRNYEYNQSEIGRYQIVTADEAWDKASKGFGILSYIRPQGSNYFANYEKINITTFTADARKTVLAYYEPKVWTGYIYPIYIFEGTAQLQDGRLAEFKMYVEAIKRVGE